jgi:hypothetical protein
MIENIVTFAVPSKQAYSDTFLDQSSSLFPYFYTNGAGTYTFRINNDLWIDDKDIVGKIIMHEVGNGTNDFLLNKCLLEVFPDSTWHSYDYSVTADPVFEYNFRPDVWVNQTSGDNKGDLVELNMNVKGGLNPFTSVMQTPTDYSSTTGDKVPFDGDDDYGTAKGKPVESLVLLAPLNTKFRRAVFTLTSTKCVIIRGITIEMVEQQRKGFG